MIHIRPLFDLRNGLHVFLVDVVMHLDTKSVFQTLAQILKIDVVAIQHQTVTKIEFVKDAIPDSEYSQEGDAR